VIRAEINPTEGAALISKHPLHPIGESLKIRLGEVATANARLVGHHHQVVTQAMGMAAKIKNPLHKHHLVRAVEKVNIHINHPIPIQEQGPGLHHRSPP
jgi:hypothetical protein